MEPVDHDMPVAPSTVCVKCTGVMEFGLLIDASQQPATSYFRGPEMVLQWVRGTPARRWFDMSFKAEGPDRLQVATLRCTRCGYVELYAPQLPPEDK